MWMPVKTNDIVLYEGVQHVVKNVRMTPDGPLLDIHPIRMESMIVHASEIKLLDSGEAEFRGKSIGLPAPSPAKQEGGRDNARSTATRRSR